MKKILSTCILAMLLVSLLVSCAKPAAPTAVPTAVDTSITLTDGLGRTVTLKEPAQRVVSMAASVTEILYAVGAGDQVVGRDSFSDYPEEAMAATDIGGSMGDYSYETIASLNPDLVIAAEINTADQVKALEDLGLTVYYLSNPTDFEGLYTAIETVGQLTGHSSDAATLTDSLALRVQAVADTISQATTTPVVFYELDGSNPVKPWTSGPGTFMDMLISKAGGQNVGAALSSSWAQISVEELLVQNPEIILLGDAAYGMTPEQVAARIGWGDIAAVKDNKIFTFNDDLVSLAGPRLVDGLETIAKMIHPELFK
jgi:iron complex transport system substrate-binding protein